MTRTEFGELCNKENVSPNLVHFENSVAEGFYVLKNYHRWEVFFRERGTDHDYMGFPSESDALTYLSERLIHK